MGELDEKDLIPMAPRGRTTRRKKPATRRGGGGGGASGVLLATLKVALLLAVGVSAGYLWRSYYPLALPFETRLVADKSSSDMEGYALAETQSRRLREVEAERDDLLRRIERLESDRAQAERELADLKIKSVLHNVD